jgi:hypothetical protein
MQQALTVRQLAGATQENPQETPEFPREAARSLLVHHTTGAAGGNLEALVA